jgi:hypothetical protein
MFILHIMSSFIMRVHISTKPLKLLLALRRNWLLLAFADPTKDDTKVNLQLL